MSVVRRGPGREGVERAGVCEEGEGVGRRGVGLWGAWVAVGRRQER